ncbi:MAG: DUF2207 domain-containing protein [Candidatus Nealsonbacteria bacterium]|nr:DUF2207 domain-containing protein [Candidatus Nealsonbacteria bacterium]
MRFRRTNLIFIFALFLFSVCPIALNAESAQEYYYYLLEADININKDSTFDVEEKQTYYLNGNFGYFYRELEQKKLDHISNIEVFDGEGNRLEKDQYEISYRGSIIEVKWNFPRRDFNKELKSWTVKYRVHGGLGFYDDWDELYWNVVFADRDVRVKQSEARIHLPEGVERKDLKTKLFVGPEGSKNQSNNIQVVDNKTVRFWARSIDPGHFMTVVVGWPKGIVEKPAFYRNEVLNWTVLFVGAGLFIFVFIKTFMLWKEKGQDPKIDKTIMAEYSPPDDLPPAIFGILVDQNVETRDITATIVDLAVRGYLRIVEKEEKFGFIKHKKYFLEKRKEADKDLLSFEKKIMRILFASGDTVSLDHLQKTFYKKIPDIKDSFYREVEKTGYFLENIEKTRRKYAKTGFKMLAGGVVLVFFFWFINVFYDAFFSRYIIQFLILEASIFFSSLIVFAFSYYMPIMTTDGKEAKWKLLGFKEYLQKAEKLRMERETVETFSKYLPYAMVLGVEKKWAERFSDIAYQKEDWYVVSSPSGGARAGAHSPGSFSSLSSSLNSFTSSLSRSVSGGSSGSGVSGGSAGGGGGGGGGGAG